MAETLTGIAAVVAVVLGSGIGMSTLSLAKHAGELAQEVKSLRADVSRLQKYVDDLQIAILKHINRSAA